jgi:hypothetical protein
MDETTTHIAIADKINDILGDGVIKNLPLFFGGNIAPDAIHAKKIIKEQIRNIPIYATGYIYTVMDTRKSPIYSSIG